MAFRAAIALVLAGATASVAGAAPTPRTVFVFHGEVESIAAAGGRLAWTDSVGRGHLLILATGKGITQMSANQHDVPRDLEMTFAGSRPLWNVTSGGNFQGIQQRVWTTSHGKALIVGDVYGDEAGEGRFITAIAGSPAGGAFGVAAMTNLDPTSGCFCRFVLSGGGVWAVGNGRSHRVPGLPPPALLARFGDEVALVPVNPAVRKDTYLRPAPDAPVEVRSLRDASTISSFDSARPLQALALTSRFVFSIVGYGKTTRLEVHSPSSGVLLRSLHPASLKWLEPGERPTPRFDAADRWFVYGNGHEVWAVDGASGRASLVARTTWDVQDVSTDGRTVTWAEVKDVSGHKIVAPRLGWLSRFRSVSIR
jgi:hypothetical protein